MTNFTFDPEDFAALTAAEDDLRDSITAAMERLRATHPGLHFTREPYGVAPQQAEGTFYGLPFYFRMRMNNITFTLGTWTVHREGVTSEPYAGFLYGYEFERIFNDLLHEAIDE